MKIVFKVDGLKKNFYHYHLNVHFLPRFILGMATASQQHKVDNQPLVAAVYQCKYCSDVPSDFFDTHFLGWGVFDVAP